MPRIDGGGFVSLANIVTNIRRELGYVVIGENVSGSRFEDLRLIVEELWHGGIRDKVVITAQDERTILEKAFELATNGSYRSVMVNGVYHSRQILDGDLSRFWPEWWYSGRMTDLFRYGVQVYVGAEMKGEIEEKVPLFHPTQEAIDEMINVAAAYATQPAPEAA